MPSGRFGRQCTESRAKVGFGGKGRLEQAMASTPLHTLTVQDVLWINFQTTKKVQTFNFARLEEATFTQYAYGESNSLLKQAARFVTSFVRMRPLDTGNLVTAFVACLSFLKLNGMAISLSDEDALRWFEGVVEGKTSASDSIASFAKPDSHYHPSPNPAVQATIRDVLQDYAGTVTKLLESDLALKS